MRMATLICAGSLDVSFTGTVCARAWMTLTEKNRASLNFSRPILRSGKILLQKCAILRNAQQTLFVRLTYDSQCCATQRKSAQFVRLELQISCSITELCRRLRAKILSDAAPASLFLYGKVSRLLQRHFGRGRSARTTGIPGNGGTLGEITPCLGDPAGSG